MEFGNIRFTFEFVVSAIYSLPVDINTSDVFETEIVCRAADADEARDCMIAYLHKIYGDSAEVLQINVFKLQLKERYNCYKCHYVRGKNYDNLLEKISLNDIII